jgi:hypothetical protein
MGRRDPGIYAALANLVFRTIDLRTVRLSHPARTMK